MPFFPAKTLDCGMRCRAVSISPQALALMTAVGPPDCAYKIFFPGMIVSVSVILFSRVYHGCAEVGRCSQQYCLSRNGDSIERLRITYQVYNRRQQALLSGAVIRKMPIRCGTAKPVV